MRTTLPVQMYRELDARERVLLLHQALLEDREPDPEIRRTTPRAQYAEANRYIRMCRGMLGILTPWALSLSQSGELMRSVAALSLMTQLARRHGAAIPVELDGATAARLQRDLDYLVPRLAVVEHVLAEVEREIGSDAVTPPEVRALLGATHAHVAAVLEMFPALVPPDATPEPRLLQSLSSAVHEH